MKLTSEEKYYLRFSSPLVVPNSILILPITDSEKLLITKIIEDIDFSEEQSGHCKTIKYMSEYIGWEKSKGERVYKKLKKLKLITKNGEINEDTLLELTKEAIMKRREQEAEKPC